MVGNVIGIVVEVLLLRVLDAVWCRSFDVHSLYPLLFSCVVAHSDDIQDFTYDRLNIHSCSKDNQEHRKTCRVWKFLPTTLGVHLRCREIVQLRFSA